MSAVSDFFEELATREHEPLLARASGTIRVDLTNGKRSVWLVTIAKGDVTVSRRNAKADCVIRTEQKVFEEIVKGKGNAMTAVLRGALTVEGAPELLVLFQRLLPGPSGRRT